MIKVNEYFGGKVKSLALQLIDGPATIGVIVPGEYEFGTSTKEIMSVTAGTLEVQLPDKSDWKTYKQGSSFEVATGKKFKVRCISNVAYLCLYR
jgi:purine/pyrimidine-nucleoside phosphorylase